MSNPCLFSPSKDEKMFRGSSLSTALFIFIRSMDGKSQPLIEKQWYAYRDIKRANNKRSANIETQFIQKIPIISRHKYLNRCRNSQAPL